MNIKRFSSAAKARLSLAVSPSARSAFRTAIDIERYYQTAQAIGAPQQRADELLAEAHRDAIEREWWFDPIAEAKRRLTEEFAALGGGTA